MRISDPRDMAGRPLALAADLQVLAAKLAAIESALFGTVTVTFTGNAPADAAWSIDGGDSWHAGGESVLVEAGTYTVSFRQVSGWTAPVNQIKQVAKGGTVNATAEYIADGTLTVTFTGTVPSGAGWSVAGVSHASGDVVSLAPGSYEVSFATVSGYTKPSTVTVTVQAGQPTSLTAEYTEQAAPSGPSYIVSGATYNTDAMGTYTLVDGLNGRNNSPVFSNGTWYLAYGYDGDDENYGWGLTTVTPTSNLYFNHTPNFWCISNDPSAPPTSGWGGGITVTAA